MIKYQTKAAAQYATQRGRRASKSYLEKLRARGPEDPRDKGPDYWRAPDGTCWYEQDALDRWVDAHLSRLEFRAPGVQPANLRPKSA